MDGGVSYSTTSVDQPQLCFTCPLPTSITPSDTNCSNDNDIRLVFRDHTGKGGLLQVCSSGLWHYMCNLNRSYERTACLQLGFNARVMGDAARITSSANPTPKDSPPILLDSYLCLEDSNSLANCIRILEGADSCGPNQLVSLSCAGMC